MIYTYNVNECTTVMGETATILLSIFSLIEIASLREGFVSEVFINERFDCPLISKKIYSVKSEVQCTHRCLLNGSCGLVNYSAKRDTEKNCEVFPRLENCSMKHKMAGWKAMKFELQENNKKEKMYKSCKDVYNDVPSAITGVYDLAIGKHYCYMEQSVGSCEGSGWTLALKADGTKSTLLGNSALWTNKEVYNIEKGLESFYENEAKFSAFHKLAFHDVCIGMKVSADVRWLKIPGIAQESLLSLFNTGTELLTTRGRAAWKGLIASSSLQRGCNKEGFNIKEGSPSTILMRIGYIANEQSDCNSCDSFLGMGAFRARSCGNIAYSSPDNGERNTPAMCYLLIK